MRTIKVEPTTKKGHLKPPNKYKYEPIIGPANVPRPVKAVSNEIYLDILCGNSP